MLTSIKDKLTRSRHTRIESQDDMNQLTELTPSVYGYPPANISQEYFDRPRTSGQYDPALSQGDQNFTPGDGDDQPLTGESTGLRRGVRNDGYSSPPLPVGMMPMKKRKSKFDCNFWGKILFCAVLFALYVYFTVLFIEAEVDPRPHYKSSSTWRAPMIVLGLASGTTIVVLFIYPWIAKKFRPSHRASLAGQIHRSNKQLGKTGLALLPFIILLPLNFAITPNIVSSVIAQNMFNHACDGWQTTYILNGIPNTALGASSGGDLISKNTHVGSLTFTGAETGWRVMYVRGPSAPNDFNDSSLQQIVFNEDGIGQSFTTLCSAVGDPNAQADTTDCTTGSALSFVMYNASSDVSMFMDEELPVVSLMFSPPATTYSANYSNWQEGPPLGSLVDQDFKEKIKVVRKGSQNACTQPIKVCGGDLLESFVAMAYVWRRWQEWGMGSGTCGT